MTRNPYPEISGADDLDDVPVDAFVEVAGNLRMLPVRADEDPVSVAREYMKRHPQCRRFRIVSMKRFSLPEETKWPPVTADGDAQVWPASP